jgi:hypothetical protein
LTFSCGEYGIDKASVTDVKVDASSKLFVIREKGDIVRLYVKTISTAE